MKQTPYLLYAAIAIVVLLVLLIVWLVTSNPGSQPVVQAAQDERTGTIPGLDLRFSYDGSVFTPAPYDDRASYPLRLDADGWSFYGKRIRGFGTMLAKQPSSMLYDFLGSQDAAEFEDYYGLLRMNQVYEDAQIAGQLALHSQLEYKFVESSKSWPGYFPDNVKAGETAHLESWALFSSEDLFYFYAVSDEPLTDDQRGACVAVLESLEFNALMGGGGAPVFDDEEAAEDATEQPPQDGREPAVGERGVTE